MTLTPVSPTPAVLPAASPPSPEETTDTSPVRVLVDDGNVKIEQIYEEVSYSPGEKYVDVAELRITTGNKDDQVSIHSGADGKINARVNGRFYELPITRGDPYYTLIIKTHGGDDRVVVDPAVDVAVDIWTGEGDDRVTAGSGNTRIFGGKGDDFIRLGSGKGLAFGEEGNDLMLAGTGNAVMSGGEGKDQMYAGIGPDSRTVYLSGDAGNDELYGGSGKVILNGGLNDDVLVGYRNTTMYTGAGKDQVHSFDTNDRIYAKKTDILHNHKAANVNEVQDNEAGKRGFKIEGPPEFTSKLENKLEELRGSPVGRKVLEEMDKLADKIGSPVTIKSAGEGGNMDSYWFKTAFTDSLTEEEILKYTNTPELGHIRDGVPGAVATQAEIIISSDYFEGRLGLSPLISLFHEMVHAYNGATGTRIPGEQPSTGADGKPLVRDGMPLEDDIHELQTVGIPNSGTPYDFDSDPTTSPTTINQYPFYENALREEMGVPLRKQYHAV